MNKFKLNFYRFADYEENINVGITMDTSTLPSSAQKVNSVMNDVSSSIMKVVEANEKLAVTSSSAKTSMKTVAEGGIRRLNASVGSIKSLAQSPFASDKFKVDTITKLGQLKNQGLDNVKIKDAEDLSKGQINKIMSVGGSLSNMGLKEAAKQEKELAKATKEALKVLEKQYPVTDKVRAKLKELGLEADKTSGKTMTFSQKIGKAFDKLKHYAVSWRIVYGVFQSVWNTLSETFDKAAAYEEALNLYTVAMGDYAIEGRRWAETISNSLHLDPKQILQYTGAFYNLVQGLGVGSDAAYTMSTNLTQLAYDMASYLNIDIESAHAKIQSAMTGQSRAVASAGIAMQQASLQELAYSLGIEKLVTDMTQAEKTYLRYIQIMRSTTNMQTDLARTIMTPENAVRVLKQQFELLGRAIGQVFIPIVMAAIPYVMAFTQILGELANRLASLLGFQLTKINYDYLGLREVDTAVEDTMDNIAGSAGKAAKSVGSSINRTLAAFDELNVVESESGGSGYPGYGGVGGDGSNILGDLEKYITGYDMLEGLNDQLTEKTKKARENLEKLFAILKPLGALFAVWKGYKWIKGLAGIATEAKNAWEKGNGLAGVIKNTLIPAITSGTSVLSTMFDATGALTGSLGGLALVLAGVGATALAEGKIIESSYKSYFDGASTLEATTIKVTAATAALGLVAGALAGPMGVLAVAAAGMVGATNAIMDYKAQMDQIVINKEIYEKMYDGQGVKIRELTGDIQGLMANTNNYLSNLNDLKSKYDSSKESVDRAKISVEDFKNMLNTQNEAISTSQIDMLTSYYDNYIEAVKNSAEASKKYGSEIITSYSKIEGASKETTAQRIADYLEAQRIEEGYSLEYVRRSKEIDLQLYKGAKTAEWAAEEHHKLDVEFGLVAETTVNATGVIDRFNGVVKDIDYSAMTPEQLEQYFNDLSTSYDTTRSKLEQAKTDTESYYDSLINKYDGYVKNLKETETTRGYLYDSEKTKLAEYSGLIERYTQEKEDAIAGYEAGLEAIDTKMKDTLAVIYADFISNGADASTEFAGTIESIENTLGKLSDVDMTEGGKKVLFTYLAGAEKAYTMMGPTYNRIFGALGMNAMDEVDKAVEKGWISVNETLKDGLNYTIESAKPEIEKESEELGSLLPAGVNKGARDPEKKKEFERIISDFGYTGQDKFRDINGIHSPSTVYAEFGKNIVLGLCQGLLDNQGLLTDAMQKISNALSKAVENTRLSFKFSSDIEGSLNNMLDKIRSFANKWKNAINSLLKNMQTAFNSLKLDTKNKVTFTAMAGITIPGFAEGGYPTSGDLFFANENGNAEYITSLGNRTAVANQDQMVNAITNAILTGMQSIETNRGITQVYIGNEKVYEGQGTYQSRQADRYGTTYVKI